MIKRCYPIPCILLVRGDHWLSNARQKAREWLTDQIDNKNLKGVFYSVDDLMKWASNLQECTGFSKKNSVYHQPVTLPISEISQNTLF